MLETGIERYFREQAEAEERLDQERLIEWRRAAVKEIAELNRELSKQTKLVAKLERKLARKERKR